MFVVDWPAAVKQPFLQLHMAWKQSRVGFALFSQLVAHVWKFVFVQHWRGGGCGRVDVPVVVAPAVLPWHVFMQVCNAASF